MKNNKMVEAINNVDDKYLNEAVCYKAKKRKINPAFAGFAAMAACFVLVLGIGALKKNPPVESGDSVGIVNPTEAVATAEAVDSVVCIDINPSIELTVNKHNKVVAAVALNADAQVVLTDMDLKNIDLGTALNAIMGSLLKNGYLDEVYNAVNVCVENDDTERATELGELVSGEISSIFDENDLIGGVNTQYCSSDDETKKLADSYGVSMGKLLLAQKVSANMGISLDVAVMLSISELWDLWDAESATLITKEEALEIAARDAKVETSALTLVSEKIQESDGVFTYVIKFTVGESKEYNYKINAVDGSVISCEFQYIVKEEVPTATPTPTVTPVPTVTPTPIATPEATVTPAPTATPTPTLTPTPEPVKEITKIEAWKIAYNDAAIGTQDVKLTRTEYLSVEKEYHFEFSVGLLDYMYVIGSVDGTILRKEVVDNTVTEDNEENLSDSVLSVEEALALALEAAGVKSDDLTMCDIKYTSNKTGAEYKIHFHVDKDHYEYTVNAATGEITEKTKPVPPHEKEEKPTPEKPVAPHEKPLGPEDSKVTITFEDEDDAELTPVPEKPLKPHEKAEAEKPVPPHEKAEAAKPAGPHEKAEAAKPAGPKAEAKVTIEFVEEK